MNSRLFCYNTLKYFTKELDVRVSRLYILSHTHTHTHTHVNCAQLRAPQKFSPEKFIIPHILQFVGVAKSGGVRIAV